MDNGNLLSKEQSEILVISVSRLVMGAAVTESMIEVEEKAGAEVDFTYKSQQDRLIIDAAQEALVILSKSHNESIYKLVIPKLLEGISASEFARDPSRVMDSLKAMTMLAGTSGSLFKSITLSL